VETLPTAYLEAVGRDMRPHGIKLMKRIVSQRNLAVGSAIVTVVMPVDVFHSITARYDLLMSLRGIILSRRRKWIQEIA